MKIGCILLAGGLSTRMGQMGGCPKTLLPLFGKPAILYSFEILSTLPAISEIVVVGDKAHEALLPPETKTALPGKERQDSVYNGFLKLSSDLDYILIHDGARPLLQKKDLIELLTIGKTQPAAALASPVRNTLKKKGSTSLSTIDRTDLWEVHTPQMVRRDLLSIGLKKAREEGWEVTDDLALIERLGFSPTLVPSSFPNIKLTYPEDIAHVSALLQIQTDHRL